MTVNMILKLPPRDQIGRLVRYCRMYSGLTQRGFAQALGVVCSTVKRYEMGICAPSAAVLTRVYRLGGCGRCGVKLSDLTAAAESFASTLRTHPRQYWIDRAKGVRESVA